MKCFHALELSDLYHYSEGKNLDPVGGWDLTRRWLVPCRCLYEMEICKDRVG